MNIFTGAAITLSPVELPHVDPWLKLVRKSLNGLGEAHPDDAASGGSASDDAEPLDRIGEEDGSAGVHLQSGVDSSDMNAPVRLALAALFLAGCGQTPAPPPATSPASAPAEPVTAAESAPALKPAPAPPTPTTTASPELRIYHIDVEQGDATLFVAPGGETLLVDAGGDGYAERIKALVKEIGVKNIDYFVATHYDEHHYGGVDELVNAVEIVQAFDRGGKDKLSGSTRYSKAYKDYARTVGGVAEALVAGDKINLDPRMTVTCLSSGGGTFGAPNRGGYLDEKNLGVSLLVEYGNFRYFIGGDIQAPTEQKILASGLGGDVDVYRADDHGSAKSSSKAFVEALSPSVVIISNGNDAKEPAPSRAALNTFAELPKPATVFQTNKQLAARDGAANVADDFIADPESKDADGTILLTVTPDRGKYVVSYRDQSHSFEIRPSERANPKVVIADLLPDPAGSDKDLEEVTLENKSGFVVDVSRWTLHDKDGDVWSLVELGTLAPNSKKTAVRHGMRMSLNNGGDEIFLVDDTQKVVDHFEYSGSKRGKRISTGH